MKRMQTPFGLVEYDDGMWTDPVEPLRGGLFHIPASGQTPIYDQLRKETGLHPAPSEYERLYDPADTILRNITREFTLRANVCDYLRPGSMLLAPSHDPRRAIFITNVT